MRFPLLDSNQRRLGNTPVPLEPWQLAVYFDYSNPTFSIIEINSLRFVLSLLLALILIGELVLGGIVYHIRSDVEQHTLQQMKYTINRYNQTGHEIFRQSWNVLQSNKIIVFEYNNARFQIECCGINGPKDWKSVSHSGKLPASCCYALQIDESCTEINSYTNGCYDEFKNSLQHNNQIIFWSALGFALIQIFAVILAFYTKCTVVRNEYEKI
ncbi:hypothetical protein AGLY_010862 [Aphis glycines]|uniref:Tetraspanin n=1 Tax=Aphis glycines TaxID=307491 RepID=A0A6G0TET4_APHGL|nr:hypothetical protein AGLY_010862 [Aphis glycines]